VEISQVRKRLKAAIDGSRQRGSQRRDRIAQAERAYQNFLEEIAIPLGRQLANAMKAEGYPFTIATPGDGLRLASDRVREDVIEIELDTSREPPEVMARISQRRGSRTIARELPIKPGAFPEEISADEVLDFLLGALEPWFER
jgi:hypothetical protein